jgi:hypothetical protein
MCAHHAVAQVYKCKRGSVIAYQDKPCPKGTQIGRVTVAKPPAPGQTPSSSASKPLPAPPPGPTPPPAPKNDYSPVAQNYKCTAFDGSIYFSASNMPQRRLVPVFALPSPPPGVPSNATTWVTDVCVAAPLKEACDHYNAEIDAVGRKARQAQPSEKKVLEREMKRLRTISNSRCRPRA